MRNAAQTQCRDYVTKNIAQIFQRAADYQQDFETLQQKLWMAHSTVNYSRLTDRNKCYVRGFLAACWQNHTSKIHYQHSYNTHTSGQYVYSADLSHFTKTYPLQVLTECW